MSSGVPVAVLVVGIGEVPRALVAAAQQILGALPDLGAAGFPPTRAPEDVHARLRAEAEAVDRGGGVLILADLCGSTLANAAYRLAEERPGYEVLCGANLAMLMKLYSVDRQALDAAALGQALAETGRQGINLCSEKLCGQAAVRAALADREVHQ